MSRTFITLSAAIIVFMGAAPTMAYTLYDDGEGNVLYWPDNHMEVVVDACALPQLGGGLDEVRAAFYTWRSAGSPYEPQLREGRVLGDVDVQDGVNSVRWIGQSWPYASNMPGMTVVWAERGTGKILEVDILLNAEHYKWSTSLNTPKAHVDVRNVLTHEVGHFTGLGHSDDPEATMYPECPRGVQFQRSLEMDDVAGIAALIEATSKTDVATYEPTMTATEPTSTTPRGAIGCSATGRPASSAGLALLLLAALYRRRGRS